MGLVINYLPTVMLFFCRITSFFVVAPLFSYKTVPNTFKIGLAAFVTFLTFTAEGTGHPVPLDAQYILLLIREVLIGLLLGLVAMFFFSAVQAAGSFMDTQIGFGIANIIDPMTGVSSPLLGNFKFMVAIMLFLSFDGHHYFLQAIMESYRWVPLDNHLFEEAAKGSISDFLVRSLGSVFAISFQLAFPIVASMFLTDLGLGLLTRVSPQFNVFVVGVPLKILLGLLMLAVLFPTFISLFHDLFGFMFNAMQQLMQLGG
jgi:flagellar biosynthetic protein FliR